MKLLAALIFGIVAGLRTFTPEAVYFGLRGGLPGILFPLAAIVEYAGDLRPNAPPRTFALSALARLASGAFIGWTVAGMTGVVLGLIGALIGTYGGLPVRAAAMRAIGNVPAALLEDAVAIALALCAYALCR